jgi:hypothetical protein
MKNIVFMLLIALCGISYSQTKVSVALDKSSILTIHGSTNLLSFKLMQFGGKIMSKPISVIATQQGAKLFLSQNKLSIGVNNFKSDNIIAQAEFYKLMKSDKYPYLKIQLNHFEIGGSSEVNQPTQGEASIDFTITGVTKQYNIPVTASLNGDYVSVSGKKRMNIKDFGLEPPLAMLGLVRVSEWIEIEFKILCKITIDEKSLAID